MLGLLPRPNEATKTWCAHQRIKAIRALPTDCQRDMQSRRCIKLQIKHESAMVDEGEQRGAGSSSSDDGRVVLAGDALRLTLPQLGTIYTTCLFGRDTH